MKSFKRWVASAILSASILVIVSLFVSGNLDAILLGDDRPIWTTAFVSFLVIIRLLIFAFDRSAVHYGKSTCKICGKEAGTPLVLRYPVSDGHICHNCFKKLGYKYWATYPYKRLLKMSSEEAAAKIQEREQYEKIN